MDIQPQIARLMTDEVLTIKELSSYLKTSEKTIYRLLSKNEIPAFKIGNAWRFKTVDIERWIEEKNKEAGA